MVCERRLQLVVICGPHASGNGLNQIELPFAARVLALVDDSPLNCSETDPKTLRGQAAIDIRGLTATGGIECLELNPPTCRDRLPGRSPLKAGFDWPSKIATNGLTRDTDLTRDFFDSMAATRQLANQLDDLCIEHRTPGYDDGALWTIGCPMKSLLFVGVGGPL